MQTFLALARFMPPPWEGGSGVWGMNSGPTVSPVVAPLAWLGVLVFRPMFTDLFPPFSEVNLAFLGGPVPVVSGEDIGIVINGLATW